MKVCIACSGGGHTTEALQLQEAWKDYEHFFLTDRRENTLPLSKKEHVHFVICPRRNPIKLAINIIQSLIVFVHEQPDVVISTGADTAVPFCYLSKLFGKKVIFIESYARILEPSLSGKIFYQKADLFLVQWKQNLKFFPKATFRGSVF